MNYKELIVTTQKNGGVSFVVLSRDEFQAVNPVFRFVVSIRSFNVEIDNRKKFLKALSQALKIINESHQEELLFLGTYKLDDETMSLDVNISTDDVKKALEIARLHKQRSVWDSKESKEIYTGYSGYNPV